MEYKNDRFKILEKIFIDIFKYLHEKDYSIEIYNSEKEVLFVFGDYEIRKRRKGEEDET